MYFESVSQSEKRVAHYGALGTRLLNFINYFQFSFAFTSL